MRKKTIILVLVLIILAISIVSGYTIFKLIQTNQQLRNYLPSLLPAERIESFDLIDKDGQKIGTSDLHRDKRPCLIFIFSTPCSKCNKNIPFWQRLSQITNGKANVYGIIMDDLNSAFNFEESAHLDFKIYVPEHIKKFREGLRIKFNFPQTILYRDGVKYLKLGNLESSDTVKILKQVRNLIQIEEV